VRTTQASLVLRALRVLGLLGLALTGLACETKTVDGADGGPILCRATTDCPSGSDCTFPIDVGCTAIGECREFPSTPDSQVSMCESPGGPACTCNGETIQVPPCWDYYAQAAVSHMGACGASDGGGD
jgi:hypothetical protein